jgi:hypothetical protein
VTRALGEWPTFGTSLAAGPGPARGGPGRRRIRDRAACRDLFKTDHPRAIDRHIDYFGTYEPPGAAEPALAVGAARSGGGRAGD